MNTPMFVRNALSVILALIVCTSCSGSYNTPGKGASNVHERWSELIDVLIDTEVHQQADFVSLWTWSDDQRAEFRHEGLAFWSDFDGDARRFEWLLMTIAFPPSYAVDVTAWAHEEGKVGPNPIQIDEQEYQAWQDEYELLRQEFWSSDLVDDSMRRLLWSLELRNKMYRLRDRHAQSDSDIHNAQLVDELLEFIGALEDPEWSVENPTSVMRATWGNYIDDIARVIRPALGWRDVLLLTQEQRLRIVEQMEANTRAPSLESFTDQLKSIGTIATPVDWQSTASDALLQVLETETWPADGWARLVMSGRSNVALQMVTREANNFPLYSRSIDPVGIREAFLQVDHLIGQLLFRELGSQQFDAMTPGDQATWLGWTTTDGPRLAPTGLYSALRDTQKSGQSPQPAELDPVALRAWYEQIESTRHEYLNNLRSADSDKVRVLYAQGYALYIILTSEWEREDKNDALYEIRDALELIYALESHEGASFVQLSQIVTSRAGKLDDFGIARAEHEAFFSKFLDSENENIRSFVEAFIGSVDLSPGASVSISVPTLDGDATVSTEDYLGDIILVDHWDTDCAPCISAFPQIHDVYEEYKGRGFEVISIAYDGTSRRDRIDRYKDQLGLTWKTLNGEGLFGAIGARYGFSGFPNYMLLDRQGRWVAGNAQMGNGANLQALLDGLLAAEKAGYYDRQPGMWRVADEDTIVYLYGTLHSVKDHFSWWSEEAQAALNRSDAIYFELAKELTPEQSATVRNRYARNPEGISLEDYLTQVQEAQVRTAATAAGLGWVEIAGYTPVFAGNEIANAFFEQRGIESRQSAESVILAKAQEQGIELRPFASFDRQMRYFADISTEGQVDWLMNSLEAADPSAFDRLFQVWFWGDAEGLEAEIIAQERETIPEAYEVLIVSRNREWADELSRLLNEETGTFFVAVGVGHLVGPDSVQSMLEDRGHEATRLH